VSCQTPDARRISEYVGRPEFSPACISNGDGTCYKDGELLEDTTNFLMTDGEEYGRLVDHLENVERRLYICLKYRRRCR